MLFTSLYTTPNACPAKPSSARILNGPSVLVSLITEPPKLTWNPPSVNDTVVTCTGSVLTLVEELKVAGGT